MLIVIFLPTILNSTLFAEEPLELSSLEGSHSVGHDQNMLGINSYNKKKWPSVKTFPDSIGSWL